MLCALRTRSSCPPIRRIQPGSAGGHGLRCAGDCDPSLQRSGSRQHECGLVIEADERALADALSDMLRAPGEELPRLGGNGQRLVRERFSWQVVGQQLADSTDGYWRGSAAFRVWADRFGATVW